MRENPALGTGEADMLLRPDGPGLLPPDMICTGGAGTVINPASAAGFEAWFSFFFFAFSVLPLASG